VAKSKLTPTVQQRICDAVAAGNYYQAACELAGIHYDTLREWVKRGEKETEGRYHEFSVALTRAQAEAEDEVVKAWKAQIPEDWRACQMFLARRFPDRWGEVKTVKAQVDLESELERMAKDAGLTPEQTAAALETAKKLLAKEG